MNNTRISVYTDVSGGQLLRVSRSIRTVLVDDEPLVLESLRTLLAYEPDIDMVAEYSW